MHTGPWTPEPPAPTRLFCCPDYPRRVRAESPSAAAAIVARYLARRRFGRPARCHGLRPDGWSQNRHTGEIVAWHYQSTVVGPRSRYGDAYPILGDLWIVVRA